MSKLLIFIVLMSIWVVFSGQFDAFHLSLGVVSAAFVTALSGDLLFRRRHISLAGRIRMLFRGMAYSLWLLLEIIKANIYVFALALHPRMREEIEPHVIRFKTSLKTDFAKFVFAQSITLTPGTVTVRVDGDEFSVHAITPRTADALPGTMQDKIKALFESEDCA
jgi:multicomponent Na+:H+ antiporter subunit E